MKRFQLEGNARNFGMYENPYGQWVGWPDIELLQQKLEAAMRVVEAAKKSSDWDHEMCEALKSWDELEVGE